MVNETNGAAKKTFEEDESKLVNGAKCSNCGYVKHEKVFQRDRCNRCNQKEIWIEK